jgi:mannose-6-phosphate isomerase
MTQLNPFLKLSPFVVSKLWGGKLLAKLKGLKSDDLIGETWEVSTLENGQSLYEGKGLREIVGPLKYLIKYINTTDNLSVQVHPNDLYAKQHENSSGKTECWFVLDAEEGAGLYLGFKPNIEKSKFQEAIYAQKDLTPYLNFYSARRGDFFFVPAGSVHAIGKGVTIAEVQQSSGITYRVWDWNRVDVDGKPRQLDVAKALDVLNFSNEENTPAFFHYSRNVFDKTVTNFISHQDFTVDILVIEKGSHQINLDPAKIYSLLNIEGTLQIELSQTKTQLASYETLVLRPNLNGNLKLVAEQKSVLLFVR